MKKKNLFFYAVVLGLAISFNGFAEEEEKIVKEVIEVSKDDSNLQYKLVTTKDGHNFRIPEDMKIIKKDGYIAPESFDEYIYGKFKKMDIKLDSMNKKLDHIETLLQSTNELKPKVSEESKSKTLSSGLLSSSSNTNSSATSTAVNES